MIAKREFSLRTLLTSDLDSPHTCISMSSCRGPVISMDSGFLLYFIKTPFCIQAFDRPWTNSFKTLCPFTAKAEGNNWITLQETCLNICKQNMCRFAGFLSTTNKNYILPYFDVYLFVCCFTSKVNSYGHGGMVSSPNHAFFLGKLEQAVNQYFVHILSRVTDNIPSWMIQRKGGEWP